MKIQNRYTSIACNRTPEALDWGDDGLIYYAACHAIAVFDPNFHGSSKIVRTFCGHKARVNTVKKLPTNAQQQVDLISGSDDGTCILWNTQDLSQPVQHVLAGHTKGVTQVDALYQSERLTVATGSADSSIRLWRIDEGGKFDCVQTITLGTGYCFALKFFLLPGSGSMMLACAMDNDLIHLYASTGNQFVLVDKLKGHADWVRGLDCVKDVEKDDLLLASASQDGFIRLWRISQRDQIQIQKSFEEFSLEEDIVLEEKVFSINHEESTYYYAVSLESVLQGHEGWVYGVHFSKQGSQLHLLSSSIDKTLTIWTPHDSGIWFESVRVGEVGGASLGFYGGKFSPTGRSIIGHGFQGSLHLWHQDQAVSSVWTPGITVGGHFEAVRDLAWDPEDGHFLVTVSADQTTRVHACWKRSDSDEVTWHEIARPQVHGYDMQCLCLLSRYRFASGAEEKIVRIFQAPGNFVENFRQLCAVKEDHEGENILKNTPKGASVPSLGLSNKAVYGDNVEKPPESKHVKDMYPEHYFTPTTMLNPPTEETLMQNTLWPEMQKLYGHGYEMYALAATADGRLIASASRATSTEHAKILIWDASTWKIVQHLQVHQLTVTQLAFAPSNTLLLAVSRDRTLSVFENKDPEATCNFQLVTHTNKQTSIHTRIIWCCDWSHDSMHFATGSRDGKVVFWERKDEQYCAKAVLELKGESVTAVAFARRKLHQDQYLVAIGLETGIIQLYEIEQDWKLLASVNQTCGHHLTVKRLAFRPIDELIQLASCGEDNMVRIYDVSC
ncbi:elongator complex protein 2-like [Topomyia yanbarensis]|uniref:elongator complex protein 2-like n=1 Tax=Topomyia yanbarensis TaxID=2498891 RepID=UPI00273C215D|nr:elongator complex protein 2-like [Topomyia yanbarensis]